MPTKDLTLFIRGAPRVYDVDSDVGEIVVIGMEEQRKGRLGQTDQISARGHHWKCWNGNQVQSNLDIVFTRSVNSAYSEWHFLVQE